MALQEGSEFLKGSAEGWMGHVPTIEIEFLPRGAGWARPADPSEREMQALNA